MNALSETDIHKVLAKLSWKLLKKEIEKTSWHKHPQELLEIIMRCESLINKRKNEEKARKRELLFSELIEYASPRIGEVIIKEYVKKLGFFKIIDECFYEILSLEGNFSALKELDPKTRVWAAINWYNQDTNILNKKIEDSVRAQKEFIVNNLSVTGDSGISVDPSAYHSQQVGALGSALMMEAYRLNWFDSVGHLVIPDKTEVTEEQTFKVGSVFFNANVWALVDNLQEQVRFLDRDFSIHPKEEFDAPPDDFKFGLFFGSNTHAEIFDHIASQRNSIRETANFLSLKADSKKNAFFAAVSSIPGSEKLKDYYVSSISLSTLLNYDVSGDENLYEGLTLSEWIGGYASLRNYCKKLLPHTETENPMSSGLATFTRVELVNGLEKEGMHKDTLIKFIENVTFHKKSRDLFDTPLIRTASGYAIITDILLGSVTSRAIISNILSRKGRFDQKGGGLENSVKNVLNAGGAEAVSYKKKYPDPEGEYEFDALVLWGGKLFVMECKNRWLCEGRPVAIYNYLKQSREDVAQVSRLVAGLKAHPEMLESAFGRSISYDEIIPCVVAGLPHAMPQKIGGIYFTDISIVSRFFSERYFGLDYFNGEKKDSKTFYDQWSSDKPSVSDFIQAISRPMQVLVAQEAIDLKSVQYPVGSSILVKSTILSTRPMDLESYQKLLSKL